LRLKSSTRDCRSSAYCSWILDNACEKSDTATQQKRKQNENFSSKINQSFLGLGINYETNVEKHSIYRHVQTVFNVCCMQLLGMYTIDILVNLDGEHYQDK
jgi:hypothetical protein